MKTEFQYSLNTELNFNKYKGQGLTLKELIDDDINYIKWLHKKRFIKMDKEAFDYLCSKAGRPQKWSYGSTKRMF